MPIRCRSFSSVYLLDAQVLRFRFFFLSRVNLLPPTRICINTREDQLLHNAKPVPIVTEICNVFAAEVEALTRRRFTILMTDC